MKTSLWLLLLLFSSFISAEILSEKTQAILIRLAYEKGLPESSQCYAVSTTKSWLAADGNRYQNVTLYFKNKSESQYSMTLLLQLDINGDFLQYYNLKHNWPEQKNYMDVRA